jgi:hypothetical protein
VAETTHLFDSILETIWPKVRRKHLYPELPYPRISKDESFAALSFKAKRIFLSQSIIEGLAPVISPQKSIEALLDHAVSRHLYCPWNLTTHLRLYAEARKVLGTKEAAQMITETFVDIAADTRCISRVETFLPELYFVFEGNKMSWLIKGILQQVWRQDLGVRDDHDAVRQLALIPYMDRSQWIPGIRRFASLARSFITDEDLKEAPPSLLSHNKGLEPYTDQEIRTGFKALAAWAQSPEKFILIAQDFDIKTDNAVHANRTEAGVGAGAGQDTPTLYYLRLAENYHLPIEVMHLRKSGATYPHHHAAWEIGHPCRDIDPWTSFGKIMPGITQVWQRNESEIFANKKMTPDLVVMIDSSSSMRHPGHKLSYAVLGAGCASDAYLRSNVRVSVYNFSDAASNGKKILQWSTNREEIYNYLCHYIGGGTRIVPEDLNDLQIEPAPDIFLITDMQILNLSILVDYFNACHNRITVVHMGGNPHVHRFKKSTELRSNLSVFSVEKREDVPKIVLGKVQEYLGFI